MPHTNIPVRTDRLRQYLLLGQGIYYSVTGIWPLIDMGSFMLVTGPKTDLWLVKTMGLILFCEGVCFIVSGAGKDRALPVSLLALMNAIALAVIDIYYSMKGIISPVYLGDAAAGIILITGWIFYFTKKAA